VCGFRRKPHNGGSKRNRWPDRGGAPQHALFHSCKRAFDLEELDVPKAKVMKIRRGVKNIVRAIRRYFGAARVSKRMLDSCKPRSTKRTGLQHIRLLTRAAPSLPSKSSAKNRKSHAGTAEPLRVTPPEAAVLKRVFLREPSVRYAKRSGTFILVGSRKPESLRRVHFDQGGKTSMDPFWLPAPGFPYPAAFWRDIKGCSPLVSIRAPRWTSCPRL